MIGLGVLALVVGVFMMSLHIFELDSEAQDMSTVALGALYGFAGLFVIVGVGMVYMGLFKMAAKGQRLVGVLVGEPHRLASVEYKTVQARNAPGELGRVHQLFFTVDDKSIVLSVRRDDVEPILSYVRGRAPHALAGQ